MSTTTLGDVALEPGDRLMTPAEVAKLFRVDPKTVTRWSKPDPKKGNSIRLGSFKTPGGHRRFRESEVLALLLGTKAGPQT